MKDPFAAFYRLTPEFLERMREQMPLRAPEIDELKKLVPFISRMADESNKRKLTEAERAELMNAAMRMEQLARLLLQDDPTRQ